MSVFDKQQIHFIGIGGSGMSGIAEILLNQGCAVSGSDIKVNKNTARLVELGAKIYKDHQASNIAGDEIVVISSAILDENPELLEARKKGLTVIPRAMMLSEIMNTYYGIAVAGTHGKTTTTSLLASVLTDGGFDPTFVIGGLLNSAGSNACLGSSKYLVAEADESDASFVYLKPQMAIVTNIDEDHLWSYGDSFERLRKTFLDFLHNLPPSGLAIVCIDDPIVREILPKIKRPIITYGFSENADLRAVNFSQDGIRASFSVYVPKSKESIRVNLNLPGKHNALNALAAIAVAVEVGVGKEKICEAFSSFGGIGRRFQIRGEYAFSNGNALVVDDYGHHPKEVEATILAARDAWPTKRLVLAFQPHRYTRTKALFDDFVKVLSLVDKLILLDVYPAGEEPIEGSNGSVLHEAICSVSAVEPLFVKREEKLSDILPDALQDGDVLLMQGAGDIGAMAANLSTVISADS